MVRRRAAPSPDDASHRRENHEAPDRVRGPSFETALRASSGWGRWVCAQRSEQNSAHSGSPPRSL